MLLKQKSNKADALEFSKYLYEEEHKSIPNTNHEPKSSVVALEGPLQKQVIDYLQYLENSGKLFFHRANVGGTYDAKRGVYRSLPPGIKEGFPDIIVLKDGVTYYIELKSNSGNQRASQKLVEEKILKAGGVYLLVRSLNFLIKKLK